jgi:hypothetical protein
MRTQLDRPGKVAQKVIWTPPLDMRTRLDRPGKVAQDPYIERPIQSQDERDMASRRSARRTHG